MNFRVPPMVEKKHDLLDNRCKDYSAFCRDLGAVPVAAVI